MAECGHCFKCREGTGCIRAISFAPSAMPNRHPSVQPILDKDKRWDRDMPAYKRLRHSGVQPARIDDSAHIESHANDQFEVEMGKLVPEGKRSQIKEGIAIAKELEVQPSQMQKGPAK